MACFELQLAHAEQYRTLLLRSGGLGSSLLLDNARWFTRIRWLIVGTLVLAGSSAAFFPEIFAQAALVPPLHWPWVLAGNLALANLVFTILLRRLENSANDRAVQLHIWFQIIIDLLVLTMLVHLVGSTDTFICFTYLFHIALACIFFPKKESLLVLALATVLYAACISLEYNGFLPRQSVYQLTAVQSDWLAQRKPPLALSAVIVWFVVWYLVSTLSEALRRRDQQLEEANLRLQRADEEKNRIMLATTHDLKAPLAGIQTNIQMLRVHLGKALPSAANDIFSRIEERASVLSQRVSDIILLSHLRSETSRRDDMMLVMLPAVVEQALFNVQDQAEAKGLKIHCDLPQAKVLDKEAQLVVLFSNLLANAVAYSAQQGLISVTADDEDDDEVTVIVRDSGIGIEEHDLPHIFDEYYRGRHAREVNEFSTGLGLSIVSAIARNLKLRLRVESLPGQGTTFAVTLRKLDPFEED